MFELDEMDLFKSKKLFSAQKGKRVFPRPVTRFKFAAISLDDPEFLGRQVKSRHGILKNLSRAVKEVGNWLVSIHLQG